MEEIVVEGRCGVCCCIGVVVSHIGVLRNRLVKVNSWTLSESSVVRRRQMQARELCCQTQIDAGNSSLNFNVDYVRCLRR